MRILSFIQSAQNTKAIRNSNLILAENVSPDAASQRRDLPPPSPSCNVPPKKSASAPCPCEGLLLASPTVPLEQTTSQPLTPLQNLIAIYFSWFCELTNHAVKLSMLTDQH